MAEELHAAAAAAAAEAYGDTSLAAAWSAPQELGRGGCASSGCRVRVRAEALSPGGPLAELWRVLACGAGALSEAELAHAVGELMRIGSALPDAPRASRAAARLRYAGR